jgi:hypothetical protein
VRYLLTLQFTGRTLEDYDALVALEDSLVRELAGLVEGDGHDFGSGEGNVFLGTDDPHRAFKAIREKLAIDALGDLRAAYKEKEAEQYIVLWPPELKHFVAL